MNVISFNFINALKMYNETRGLVNYTVMFHVASIQVYEAK